MGRCDTTGFEGGDSLFNKGTLLERGQTTMQLAKITLLSVIVMGLIFSSAFAGGNLEKGKANFNDPKAFGAPGETSCNSCHPDGKGLEKSGMEGKKEWKTPVAVLTSLEDAINVCIMMANKGKAIDPKSGEMKDLIAY